MRKRPIKYTHIAVMFCAVTALLFIPMIPVNAMEAGATAINTKLNNLLQLMYAAISAIGTMLALWGIAEWGIAWQGQDGIMQASAWKRIAGGIIVAAAPQILPEIL